MDIIQAGEMVRKMQGDIGGRCTLVSMDTRNDPVVDIPETSLVIMGIELVETTIVITLSGNHEFAIAVSIQDTEIVPFLFGYLLTRQTEEGDYCAQLIFD